jgi:hypothetical protein
LNWIERKPKAGELPQGEPARFRTLPSIAEAELVLQVGSPKVRASPSMLRENSMAFP